MQVRDVMTSEVITVRPGTSLKEVATILTECRISGVPVVDEEGRVVGVVSEGDILFKERGPSERKGMLARLTEAHELEERLKHEAHAAAEAMTAPAKTIVAWRPVSAAAAQMLDEGVNRLPVVDDQGRLVGIVTRADLVRAFVRPDADIEREIREKVLARTLLLESPGAVTVSVVDGKVVLGGSARMRTDAELVPRLVAKVPGVVEVASSIGWREDNRRHQVRISTWGRTARNDVVSGVDHRASF
ncbi:MAG TPA: CBS domain-containing protein [Gaiellaceae bacterium]|nr:CBS domain-containing protein [Gaiellaceae bacterium]